MVAGVLGCQLGRPPGRGFGLLQPVGLPVARPEHQRPGARRAVRTRELHLPPGKRPTECGRVVRHMHPDVSSLPTPVLLFGLRVPNIAQSLIIDREPVAIRAELLRERTHDSDEPIAGPPWFARASNRPPERT
jgi:hypothetical protein